MISMSLQSAFEKLTPPKGEDVGNFLNSCAEALRVRSDAELASEMDVPATTIANWRRRHIIPTDYHPWFKEIMPNIVLQLNPRPRPAFSNRATLSVINFIRNMDELYSWDGYPDAFPLAVRLAGILSLAEFFVQRSSAEVRFSTRGVAEVVAAEIAAILVFDGTLSPRTAEGPQSPEPDDRLPS